jgi:hypothetical protein
MNIQMNELYDISIRHTMFFEKKKLLKQIWFTQGFQSFVATN